MRELGQLRREVAAWLDKRRLLDPLEQYATQLDAIETLMERVSAALESAVQAVDLAAGVGAVADACATLELRILWLRRLWKYYRERFDQRDDETLKPLLAAADEVIWSAYRPVVAMAGQVPIAVTRGASPLPFVDAQYAAAATPRSWVPPELKRDGGPLLTMVERLPIPLVQVPVSCQSSPWWLVFLGHEAGHHLLQDLELAQPLENAIYAAVKEAAGDPALAQQWENWHEEVFADACLVAGFGPAAAVRALEEFELAPEARMRAFRPQYPPPLIRLQLARELGAAMKLSGPAPAAVPQAELDKHFRVLPAVAAAVTGELRGQGSSLTALMMSDAAQFDLRWPDRPPANDLSGPRRLASAALLEWARLTDAGTATDEALDALRREALTQMAIPRNPGRRASAQKVDAKEAAEDLAGSLLVASPDTLRAQVVG